jgi:integrase
MCGYLAALIYGGRMVGDGLSRSLNIWLEMVPGGRDGWVFPSERGDTPIRHDNYWKRYFAPHLKSAGLEWANFQVMRRTHATLLDESRGGPAGPHRSDGLKLSVWCGYIKL